MSEVRSVHLHQKTSTFSYQDKSEKHFRKNMSAKTICLDATKIEKNSRMDNRERRCPTSLLSLSSLSSLSSALVVGHWCRRRARRSLATSPSFVKGRGLGWNVNIFILLLNYSCSIFYYRRYHYDIGNTSSLLERCCLCRNVGAQHKKIENNNITMFTFLHY